MSVSLERSEPENEDHASLRTAPDSRDTESGSSNGTPRRRRSPANSSDSQNVPDATRRYTNETTGRRTAPSDYIDIVEGVGVDEPMIRFPEPSDVYNWYDCWNSSVIKTLFFRKRGAKTLSALVWATVHFFTAMVSAPIIISRLDDAALFGKNDAIILLVNFTATTGFMVSLYACTERHFDRSSSDGSNLDGLPTYKELQKLKKKGTLEESYPTNAVSTSQVETVNEINGGELGLR